MALNKEQNEVLAQLLVRLMPGSDFTVHSYDNYRVDWRDARPMPTEAQLVAEYTKLQGEKVAATSKEAEKAALRSTIATRAAATTTLPELKSVVQDLIKILSE